MSETRLCAGCGAPATGEAVLMPSPPTVARLLAMHHAHRDGDSWPSAWLCDSCQTRAAPVFSALASLPTDELVDLTTGTLELACRLGLAGAALEAAEREERLERERGFVERLGDELKDDLRAGRALRFLLTLDELDELRTLVDRFEYADGTCAIALVRDLDDAELYFEPYPHAPDTPQVRVRRP